MLPFKYIVFYPVNIINGRLTLDEIYTGVLIQIGWIAVMAVIAKICWKYGMRKFVAVGG